MNKNTYFSVKEIALAGILTSITIVVGMFASFPFAGGRIYLVGAMIFILPLFLRLHMALIATLISVVMADLYTGFIAWTWMSIIAYTLPVFLIKFSLAFKNKLFYVLSLLVSSIYITLVYFIFEWVTISQSVAIQDLIATSLQSAINIFIASALWVFLKPLQSLVG